MPEPIIDVQGVTKEYMAGNEAVPVLHGVELQIAAGEFVGMVGPSGSGKSTLLNLIAGLDKPTTGRIVIGNHVISEMEEAEIARWRSAHVGFVFQFHHLIPVLNAFENVELPLLVFRMSARRRRRQVQTALELVGLSHRLTHRPGQLSGGEQQRVGIARALVTDPTLIVADEPTGDLDSHTSAEILDVLQSVNQDCGKTILLVTHDPVAALRSQRVFRLNMGRLVVEPLENIREALPGSWGPAQE